MPKPGKYWRQLSAADYAALFPAKPAALRKIAYGLRKLAAIGEGGVTISTAYRAGKGNQVFTINQKDLAYSCNVSLRTLRQYLWLFESYGPGSHLPQQLTGGPALPQANPPGPLRDHSEHGRR